MRSDRPKRSLEERVARAAEQLLATLSHVCVTAVFIRIGWLAPVDFRRWRQGRVTFLEDCLQASAGRIREARASLDRWAASKGLVQSQGQYVRKTREGIADLRFTQAGDAAAEAAYRACYLPAVLPAKQRERLDARIRREPETVLFEVLRDSECAECGAALGKGNLLLLETEEPLCLRCARLDDLEYLHRGDAALTRRASRYSGRKAVVVRFSRTRRRYERQGLLLESAAIERARKELSC